MGVLLVSLAASCTDSHVPPLREAVVCRAEHLAEPVTIVQQSSADGRFCLQGIFDGPLMMPTDLGGPGVEVTGVYRLSGFIRAAGPCDPPRVTENDTRAGPIEMSGVVSSSHDGSGPTFDIDVLIRFRDSVDGTPGTEEHFLAVGATGTDRCEPVR